MLFPLHPETPLCRVFHTLNDELLHFLESSVVATVFDERLFSTYQVDGRDVRSACWENEPTQEKFRALWNALPPQIGDREKLFELVNSAQDIACFFENEAIPIPELPSDDLYEVFKSLTTHMFTKSRVLSGIKKQSNSSIEQHFQEFRQANQHTQLCFLCGTAALSQDRSGVEADEQWRADYDHVLCKDKYPIYSAHPGNFVPTCHFCNSKAKGAKNMLLCANSTRRIAFYPLPPANDSCYQYASIIPKFRTVEQLINGNWEDPAYDADVLFSGAPENLRLKIEVWEEIYDMPRRVKAHVVANVCDRLSSELRPDDFDDFRTQLARLAGSTPRDYKSVEWRFWWQKVYEHLNAQSDEELRNVWSLIQWKWQSSNDADMQVIFGI